MAEERGAEDEGPQRNLRGRGSRTRGPATPHPRVPCRPVVHRGSRPDCLPRLTDEPRGLRIASADLNRAEDGTEDPLSAGQMDRTGEVEVERDAHGPAPRHVKGRGGLELATRDDQCDGRAVAQNPVHRIHDEPKLGVLPRGGAVQREEPREIREGDEIDRRRRQGEVDPTALDPRIRAMDLDVREDDVQLSPLGRCIADIHVEHPRCDGTQERNPADQKQAGDRHGKYGARPHRSTSATIIRGEGYIRSRNFPHSITGASCGGDWRDEADRSVDAVDRFSSQPLIVRLREDLAALVQGEFRLSFEDEHDFHVADPPAAAPQALGGFRQVQPPRLLQRGDERGGRATRLQQVVAHPAVLGGSGAGGPLALNFSAASLARQDGTRLGRSSFVSSARIWSNRAWVDGRGGPRRSQISGPFDTSYVPIAFARSTISCLSKPIRGRRMGWWATASIARRLATVWLET